MFILRRITSEHKVFNIILGDSYNLVLKEHDEDDYNVWLKKYFNNIVTSDAHIYGFIIHDNGSKIIPLYNKSANFVMTSDGNTFSNVTLK